MPRRKQNRPFVRPALLSSHPRATSAPIAHFLGNHQLWQTLKIQQMGSREWSWKPPQAGIDHVDIHRHTWQLPTCLYCLAASITANRIWRRELSREDLHEGGAGLNFPIESLHRKKQNPWGWQYDKTKEVISNSRVMGINVLRRSSLFPSFFLFSPPKYLSFSFFFSRRWRKLLGNLPFSGYNRAKIAWLPTRSGILMDIISVRLRRRVSATRLYQQNSSLKKQKSVWAMELILKLVMLSLV